MADRRRRARFFEEIIEKLRVSRQILAQEFDRYFAVEGRIKSAVDSPHAAVRNLLEQIKMAQF